MPFYRRLYENNFAAPTANRFQNLKVCTHFVFTKLSSYNDVAVFSNPERKLIQALAADLQSLQTRREVLR